MKFAIERIEVSDLYDSKPIKINLSGKNLIITGGNGCGKTRFIQRIYKYIYGRIANRDNPTLEYIDSEIKRLSRDLQSVTVGSSHWSYITSELPRLEIRKKELEAFQIVYLDDCEGEFLASFHQGLSIISYFKADRQAQINKVNSIRPLNILKEQGKQLAINHNYDFNNQPSKAANFEEYLASLKQVRSFYITEYDDAAKAEIISLWFAKLEADFRELFEDDSLRLNFIAEESSFEICQRGKEPYRFQNLSSGYASILSVYADLIMTVEVRDISPDQLNGIVIIDEIDAHLHISLQKKILSFLTSAYKNIQFIVTTHSPFVVMSVNDAVIYDLSKKEQVEDLSMYSYNSVAKSLFDTLPLSSVLFDKINLLYQLALDKHKSKEQEVEMDELLQEITPHFDKLDAESQFFFSFSKVEFLKNKGGN
ncbi:MAG: AAA family ATPase [Clostridium sp.]|nr:AAA family ATPase [Clostridium sp.]